MLSASDSTSVEPWCLKTGPERRMSFRHLWFQTSAVTFWLLRQNDASWFSSHFVMTCIHHAGRDLLWEGEGLETFLQSRALRLGWQIDFHEFDPLPPQSACWSYSSRAVNSRGRACTPARLLCTHVNILLLSQNSLIYLVLHLSKAAFDYIWDSFSTLILFGANCG